MTRDYEKEPYGYGIGKIGRKMEGKIMNTKTPEILTVIQCGNFSVVQDENGDDIAQFSSGSDAQTFVNASCMRVALKTVLDNLGRMDDGQRCYTRHDEASMVLIESILSKIEGGK